ncbi:NDR1/HIN1-like protein 2 [Lycium ferocissimum]|uniref:NDR1/HIN1-like protein 2 n=1 Tax=Lycium ferocissimum TaxID=112874 RepID=UPI0028160D30|nr:NDR1/HIN1-like protein 2 [Lycium ferocissimum]
MPEPHLNGAYYGPSIPPPSSKTYHRPGHSSSPSCCCNPFTCCCSCIFNCICTCIFQILCTLLIIVAVIGFILWFILRPNKVNFHVANAQLTQFSYSNNNTLNYYLALNVSIRNPNKRIGIYYDLIEARGFYHGVNFGNSSIDPFYQGHKNTTDLDLLFKGTKNEIKLGDYYNGEKDDGVYEIGVKLYMRIRFKFGWIKTKKIKPMIKCDLKVPFKGKGSFERTQCHLDW